jgi:hypothetical protein
MRVLRAAEAVLEASGSGPLGHPTPHTPEFGQTRGTIEYAGKFLEIRTSWQSGVEGSRLFRAVSGARFCNLGKGWAA